MVKTARKVRAAIFPIIVYKLWTCHFSHTQRCLSFVSLTSIPPPPILVDLLLTYRNLHNIENGQEKVNVKTRNVVRKGQGTTGEGTRGSDKEQWEGRTRNCRDKEQCSGGTRSCGKEGQGEVLGKDTEQWEKVVRNSGIKNSVMEGQGTVGGMEKEQMEWRDKEQCEGNTRNRGVEGQGAMNGRKGQGTFGGMEKNWKRKGQGTM